MLRYVLCARQRVVPATLRNQRGSWTSESKKSLPQQFMCTSSSRQVDGVFSRQIGGACGSDWEGASKPQSGSTPGILHVSVCIDEVLQASCRKLWQTIFINCRISIKQKTKLLNYEITYYTVCSTISVPDIHIGDICIVFL